MPAGRVLASAGCRLRGAFPGDRRGCAPISFTGVPLLRPDYLPKALPPGASTPACRRDSRVQPATTPERRCARGRRRQAGGPSRWALWVCRDPGLFGAGREELEARRMRGLALASRVLGPQRSCVPTRHCSPGAGAACCANSRRGAAGKQGWGPRGGRVVLQRLVPGEHG